MIDLLQAFFKVLPYALDALRLLRDKNHEIFLQGTQR